MLTGVLYPTKDAMRAITTMLVTIQMMETMMYLRIQTIHVSAPRAIATPTNHHRGALVNTPKRMTVNLVTSMNGKESTQAVGATMRKRRVAKRELANSVMSPPLRNPTERASTPMTVGKISASAPPRTGATVVRLGAKETSRFTPGA